MGVESSQSLTNQYYSSAEFFTDFTTRSTSSNSCLTLSVVSLRIVRGKYIPSQKMSSSGNCRNCSYVLYCENNSALISSTVLKRLFTECKYPTMRSSDSFLQPTRAGFFLPAIFNSPFRILFFADFALRILLLLLSAEALLL